MTVPPLPPPVLIQDPDTLRRMVTALAAEKRIAVDTESNSLHAYRERVCLIQFSTPESDYLVDPLALSDLAPLGPIFADPGLEKVIHAAEYDLICLRRDFDFQVDRLFDTRVACRTLGQVQAGLGDLLSETFDVHLNKRFQRANWGQRPLTPDLLDYARLDTHFLLPLRDRLAEALQAAGRCEEAIEECERLTHLEAHENGFDPEGFWHIANARHLTPEQAGALRQLYLLREDQASRADRPPFKIMGDKTLLAIAQVLPSNEEDLQVIPGMTAGQIRRYGRGLLTAVARGRREPRPRRPSGDKVDETVLARHEALRDWRKKVAAARLVESDVILPREVLWEIARTAPRNGDELQAIMTPLHWRFRTYGQDILRVLWG
jgi:ribonuclease D